VLVSTHCPEQTVCEQGLPDVLLVVELLLAVAPDPVSHPTHGS
jgi:hypothetical protein